MISQHLNTLKPQHLNILTPQHFDTSTTSLRRRVGRVKERRSLQYLLKTGNLPLVFTKYPLKTRLHNFLVYTDEVQERREDGRPTTKVHNSTDPRGRGSDRNCSSGVYLIRDSLFFTLCFTHNKFTPLKEQCHR